MKPIKGIGGPLGEGDFKKGRRVQFMLALAARLHELGFVPMFELKGDDLSGGWVEELYALMKPFGGILTWHWSPKSTKKLGDPSEPISEQLRQMAIRASELQASVGLRAVTIHCAPAMAIEPSADVGYERYNSPIEAVEMLAHIERQVEPLRELNMLCGGILQIETVDIANFRDGGFKLPNFLALQTGSWLDLLWLARSAGVEITFDSEHHLCAGNVLMRTREMLDLPIEYNRDATDDELKLLTMTGYYLRKGRPPYSSGEIGMGWFIVAARPRLFHFGGAVQAYNDKGEICTHLPYDRKNKEQMDLLDMQLNWMMVDDNCIGGVTEVVGELYADDPANPGHNRYSPWSERITDDEEAKEQTILTIIKRLEALTI